VGTLAVRVNERMIEDRLTPLPWKRQGSFPRKNSLSNQAVEAVR
jgi:hypothetical protein